MLDIDSLEKRWRVYKFKSYLPYLIIFTILVVTLAMFSINIEKENSYTIKKLDKKVLVSDKNVTSTKIIDKITLYPSMNFLNEIDKKDYIEPKKVKVRVKTKPVQDVKSETLMIKHQHNEGDIKNLIKRFEKNSNPSLSLFIARKYYKLGIYDKAYKYALITNEIDNKIEGSWLIFTKSLVKLGRKQKAIDLLTKYIKHSDSQNAKLLLSDIKSGKLK